MDYFRNRSVAAPLLLLLLSFRIRGVSMRIGSRLYGVDLVAQNNLNQAMGQLLKSSIRLSTMQRINRGSDDPAGLIAAEDLRAELEALQAAQHNASRASGTIHVADAALAEVGDLLNSVQANVVAAAGGGLSDEELAAKQIEVNAALEAIDRIGNYTSFGGRKLLEGGSLTFLVSSDVSQTTELSLPDISAATLGGDSGRLTDLAAGGSADLRSGNLAQAAEIVAGARSEVLQARAELGAFEKYTIESSRRIVDSMEVNLSSALSRIVDTDVAEESSRLIQSQILVQAAVSTLQWTGHRRTLIAGLLSGE